MHAASRAELKVAFAGDIVAIGKLLKCGIIIVYSTKRFSNYSMEIVMKSHLILR